MTGTSDQLACVLQLGGANPEGQHLPRCRLGRKDMMLAELAASCLKGHSARDFTVFVAFETQGVPVTRDLERPES